MSKQAKRFSQSVVREPVMKTVTCNACGVKQTFERCRPMEFQECEECGHVIDMHPALRKLIQSKADPSVRVSVNTIDLCKDKLEIIKGIAAHDLGVAYEVAKRLF